MTIGFIGGGNMAKAMIGGIVSKGVARTEEIIVSGPRDHVTDVYKVRFTTDNAENAAASDVLFLSVKPQMYEAVIAGIKDSVKEGAVIVTIAPGKSLGWLQEQFGRELPMVRTMPNTPAMVGAGMTAVCLNEFVTEEQKETVLEIIGSFGKAEIIPEKLMDVVPAVSGSSPAYVYILIEAMADAAVADGMPRAQAYRFAAQAVLGSAQMVLESGLHPGALKDMVCSPAGTTIQAVRMLEKNGFRSAVIEAMLACTEKSRQL